MEQVGVEGEDTSARCQDAPRLREGRQKIRYVVQHAAESHRVEGAVRERKPAGVGLTPVRRGELPARHGERLEGEINANVAGGAVLIDLAGLPRSAPDVEQTR